MKNVSEEREAQHGTMTEYSRGCKCEECRAANAAYHRALRQRSPEAREAWNAYLREWRRKRRESGEV